MRRSCRIQNRRYDDRLCRVRFYAINRRRTARRACARARRRRRAIDDGLGAASYSVQSLDRAGKLGPVRTSCEGCHVSECGVQDRSKIAVQHCRYTLVSADRCYRAIRHDFVTPNIVEKRRQIIWKLTFAVPCCKISAPSDIEKAIYFAAPERVVGFRLGCLPVRPSSSCSRVWSL